jgi:CheY-like chemotaxis protein
MNSATRLILTSLLIKMKVFVIEKDSESRKIYSYLLEDHGATVKLFSSFEEAVKTLEWMEPSVVICAMSFLDKDAQVFKRKLRDLEMKTGRHTRLIFSTEVYVTDAAGVAQFTDSMNVKLLQAVGCNYSRAQKIVNG